MADAGARLFIVGFESGDPQILKNIKKGATVEMARDFMKNCRKVGIRVHGDFIIGLPGETRETIQKTIEFAKELDSETIQVSLAHAMPGTELARLDGQGRLPEGGSAGGYERPPIAAHRVPASFEVRNDGGREPVLRRLLFPAARWCGAS